MDVYLLENIYGPILGAPLQQTLPEEWGINEETDLADPFFRQPPTPDMLLGVEVFSEILNNGLKKSPGQPSALKTSLGWVVLGSTSRTEIKCLMTDAKLRMAIKDFWGESLSPTQE